MSSWGPTHPQADARQSLIELGLAWALVLACCAHHAGHLLHAAGLHGAAHSPLLAALSDQRLSGALGAFALLGPGRRCAGGLGRGMGWLRAGVG